MTESWLLITTASTEVWDAGNLFGGWLYKHKGATRWSTAGERKAAGRERGGGNVIEMGNCAAYVYCHTIYRSWKGRRSGGRTAESAAESDGSEHGHCAPTAARYV